MAFALNAEHERQLEDILSRHPNKMAACIPTLHLCQEANENWVSEDVIAFVAKRLELSTAHVQGVVTFYTLFNQKKPGKHQVWVCHTLSCALRGAEERLTPVLLTALLTALALLPVALQLHQPGHEIEGPMAVVILGGLVSSTLVSLLLVPPLAVRWLRPG